MTHPVEISFTATDVAGLAERPGRIAILVPKTGRLPAGLPRATREAVGRAFASEAWKAVKPGKALELAFPAGLKAESLQIVLLPSGADVATSRAAGASIGARLGKADTLVLAGNHARAAEVALGLALRAYDFSAYKTKKSGNGAAAEGETRPSPPRPPATPARPRMRGSRMRQAPTSRRPGRLRAPRRAAG